MQIIGAELCEGRHLQAASLVSKSWRASIAAGLTSTELDMHPDPERWARGVGGRLPA